MRASTLGLAGGWLSCLVACGGGAPPARVPVYSPDRYVVAEGTGEALAVAEASARARVAEQVSARIQADFEVETRSDGQREAHRIRETVRSEAGFARGELIEVVERGCVPAGCRAVAVLDRVRAEAALAVEYAEPAGRFRRAAEGALAASTLPQFTRHLRAAEAAWPGLVPLARQRQVLVRRTPPEVESDQRLRARLSEVRDRHRARLQVTVLPGDLADLPVATALAAALTELGVPARPGATCREGLALVPGGAVVCAEGSFGPRCALDLTATLTPCGGGEPLAVLDLRAIYWVGASPHSEADARRRLAERLTVERLRPLLAEPLQALLPL